MKAVDEFSIEVENGELLAVLGPSGCGKSTLLACTGGIEDVNAGRIELGGRCLVDVGEGVFVPPEKREIGFMFQNYALWPHMSVERNISYPLRIRGCPKDFIEQETGRVLGLMRLEEQRKKHPWQLSGGEQQRTALGRALIMKPKLLLLDEPLSNLDAKLREEMQSEIRKIQQKLELTAVHVTHDQSEALAMSDRVVVMNKGRLVQLGSPDEIYNHPSSRFTAEFMGTNNLIEGKINAVSGRLCFSGERGFLRGLPADGAPQSAVLSDVVLCVIRPEDIVISRHKPAGPGCYTSLVVERVYRGAHFLYTIDAEGQRIKVQTHSSELFEPGAVVYFQIKKMQYLPN